MNQARGILTEVERIDCGLPGAVLLLARYREDRFDRGLFRSAGIPVPETLAAATDRRLCEYLAGRLLAGQALALLNLPAAPIGRAADRQPIWPHGLAGSLSHARGFAACLVAPAGHPGVDVETPARDRALAALRRHALTDTDRAALSEADPILITAVFSAKETLFKALYPDVGRSFGFDASELAGTTDAPDLCLRLTRDLAPGLPKGRRFDIRVRQKADHVLTWLLQPTL
jgi:enterobactin synthetase component D